MGARLRASAAAAAAGTTAAASSTGCSRLAQGVRVAFWSGHLCERGTDTALYDYADCGETELGLVSYVLYGIHHPDNFDGCVAKFRERFGKRLVGVENGFAGVDAVLERMGIPHLYMIKIVNDKETVSKLPGVRTCIHSVFYGEGGAHGDVYARISPCVTGNAPIVPHIVRPPTDLHGPNLREELGIPANAVVFGRHGGYETFDIPFVRQAIVSLARSAPANLFFLLMNTPPLWDPLPNIVHMPKTSDPARKAAFIRTCDAMVHARQGGESFGLAIAEFSVFNKPVLTSSVHHDEHKARFHLDALGSKALVYHDQPSFLAKVARCLDRERLADGTTDWNAYRGFAPGPVMRQFHSVFLSGFEHLPPPSPSLQSIAPPPPSELSRSGTATNLAPMACKKVDGLSEKAKLVARMEVLDRELGALVRLPLEPEVVFVVPQEFEVLFQPFVPIRLAPSTSAGAVGRLNQGERCFASASRGPPNGAWLRLYARAQLADGMRQPPPQGEKLERWALSHHPVLGKMLRAVTVSEVGTDAT